MDPKEPKKYILKYVTEASITLSGVDIQRSNVGVKKMPISVIKKLTINPNATVV